MLFNEKDFKLGSLELNLIAAKTANNVLERKTEKMIDRYAEVANTIQIMLLQLHNLKKEIEKIRGTNE